MLFVISFWKIGEKVKLLVPFGRATNYNDWTLLIYAVELEDKKVYFLIIMLGSLSY